MEKIQLINTNGFYDCKIPVSGEEWYDILQDKKLTTVEVWTVLKALWDPPNHRSTCTELGKKLGMSPHACNNVVWTFGKRVQQQLARFQVVGTDDKPSFWSIPMKGRNLKNGYFEWELRPELASAVGRDWNVHRLLLKQAIEEYKQYIPKYWDDEKFKWKAIQQFQNIWDENAENFAQMLEAATAETENLLAASYHFPRARILEFAQAEPETVRQMFRDLFDESLDVVDRANHFKEKADELNELYPGKNGNHHYQLANAISTYLWLRFPQKYSLYKYSVYTDVAEKLHYHLFLKSKPTCAPLESAFPMADYFCSELKKDPEIPVLIQDLISKEPNPELYDRDDSLRTTTIDFCYFVSKFFNPAHKPQKPTMKNPWQKYVDLLKLRKNIILQGAPGTGKTYTTAMIALGIIGVNDVDFSDHKQVMKRYEELQKEGRIFFTTFHQSMDYEDFVEGLRPVPLEGGGGVTYEVKDGIFKQVCQKAKESPEYAKIEDFIDKYIASIQGYENRKEISTITGRSSLYVWRTGSNNTIKTRSTASQIEDLEYSPAQLNIEKIKLQAKGDGHENNWRYYAEAFINAVKKEYRLEDEHSTRPVVLIIDEINRGNVSKIFGELITLLEPDKRIGEAHPVQVALPYSPTPFGIPSNVYIIGTMNTTDRSTGTLDYALRRRFAFVTLSADEIYITNEKGKDLFRNIKKFVECFQSGELELDDLMVGHSYFMAKDDEELKLKMEFEVIPLLKEYVKDGFLRNDEERMMPYFNAWLQLNTYQAEKEENENS